MEQTELETVLTHLLRKEEFLEKSNFVLVYDESRPDAFTKIKSSIAKYARADSSLLEKIGRIGYHSVIIVGTSSFLPLISA